MKRTLVIGASLNEDRYSYLAMRSLLRDGNQVVAIGLVQTEILGVQIVTERINFTDIHTVTLYLNPKRQVEYYNYIISLQPERVIFNPGTENPTFYKLLKQHNIYFEEACTLILLSTNQY